MFEARFREALKGSGLTLEDLAEQIDLSVSGVKKWLYGQSDPSLSAVARAATALNVSLDWLAYGRGEMHAVGHGAVSVASLDYQGSGNLDGELLGRLTEAVQALYREANQRIGLGQSVKIATNLYREIAEVPEDERPGATTLRLNQLRRELIAATTGPATGKSSA